MSNNDAKLLVGGAYSLKYQLLEQERLRRLQLEHKDCSKAQRERAHLLSKQTQQRRRALEEKKQAMAKAEEERRRKALEERRKQQRDATERFRTALTRQNHVIRTPKSFEVSYLLAAEPFKHIPKEKPIINRTNDRIVLGREVEIGGPSIKRRDTPPDMEQVLRCIRGKQLDSIPSMENILLTPGPTDRIPNATPPIPTDTIREATQTIPTMPNATPPIPTDTIPNAVPPITDTIPEATPLKQCIEEISTDSSTISILNDSLESIADTEIMISENNKEELISPITETKGILKKHSSPSSSAKKVRFSDTIEQRHTATIRLATTNVLSTNVTRLNGCVSRNGVTIHVPTTNTIPYYKHRDSNNVWTHINSFVQNNHDRHYNKRYHQPPVKLWKRQIKSPEVDNVSCEEKRLMESIEIINNKLRTIPLTNRTTTEQGPLLVRSQTSNNQLLLRKTTQQYRTYY